MKQEKGITLVALIITIIVLLILAVVAINAVKGDGIIAHAKNAKNDYGAAQDEENTILGNYMIKLNEAQGENGAGGTTLEGGKTLNPNCVQTSEIQTVLALCGYENFSNDGWKQQNLKYKLVYKNEINEEIIISVKNGDTIERTIVDLEYKNDNYRIASESVKEMNLSYDCSAYGIYDKANVWTIRNGTTLCVTEYCPHFIEVTNLPVFAGTWTIDETKSTALGKQYLSSCLVDAE